MRRGIALRAEVVFGLDNAPAEILLPDAIDDDARGERIVRGNNPAGEVEAVESISRGVGARGPNARVVFQNAFGETPALTPALSPRRG